MKPASRDESALIILPPSCASTANCAYTARIVRKWMLTLALCCASAVETAAQPTAAHSDAAQPVTFARDVAPIIYARCAPCHRNGGDGPFGLMTFEEVRARARTIAEVTRTGYMPPWKPTQDSAAMAGDRRLRAVELQTIRTWIEAGMARGDDRDLPAPPPAAGGWTDGVPDLIVQLPEYALRADGGDVFRNFVVPTGVDRLRYVSRWQFRAGSTGIHHANIRIDATPASRRLDETDPAPGYEGIILRSADFPDGDFLGWTPGQRLAGDPQSAWELPANADFVVQLHMRPTGKIEKIAPVIGLYFSDAPPPVRPVMLRLGRQRLSIPAGDSQHVVRDQFMLPVAAEAHAALAHAHYRARALRAWAELPDRTQRPLLSIDDWDPAWQERYQFRSPIALPAGTTVHLEYVFDNSAGNIRNPAVPLQPAEWGWRTADEMGDLWLQMKTAAGDRDALDRAARLKMQTEDAIGCETLIAREPARVDLRNDAGTIYMAIDRPADALRHFRKVTELQPALAQGWFNAGVANEAIGRLDAAERDYQAATTRDPHYSVALNNLASLWIREGRAAAARPLLDRAVQADAGNIEAQGNLALLLLTGGDAAAAVDHLVAAVTIRPDRAAGMVQLAELIVRATRHRDPRALDALGISYAAGGKFDAAIAAAVDALAAHPQSGLADQIGARLSLYRAGKPFVAHP